MKLLIKTDSNNWDHSLIVAQGLTRDGYPLASAQTSTLARDLPENYMSVWHGIVETMRGNGLADGGRLCVMAEAEMGQSIQTDGDAISEITYVKLVTHWQWEDGRTTTETLHLFDSSVIDLVQYLLDESIY